MRKFTITIDKAVLYEYYEYYFNKYPKRKKLPIENPIHPSINKWSIMPRPQMNDLKQTWKEFVLWLVEHNQLSNAMIEKSIITMNLYFPTRIRKDIDNYTPKFIMDGLTESKLIIDDDYTHVVELKIHLFYDKTNPRTEIIIEEIEGEE